GRGGRRSRCSWRPSSADRGPESMLIQSTLTRVLASTSMTLCVGAGEAPRLLGVQKATLYAYVSRGLIDRRVAVDGRTSMYAVDDVEALVGRVRGREAEP